LISLIVAGSLSTYAHHSIGGEFETGRVVEVTGVATEYQLINPHSYIVLEVEAANGAKERWTLTYVCLRGAASGADARSRPVMRVASI
jgi:hypothetical protein